MGQWGSAPKPHPRQPPPFPPEAGRLAGKEKNNFFQPVSPSLSHQHLGELLMNACGVGRWGGGDVVPAPPTPSFQVQPGLGLWVSSRPRSQDPGSPSKDVITWLIYAKAHSCLNWVMASGNS